MAGHEIPNAQKVCYVTWKDLPLSCPTPAMSLWNSHQRVYLDIQEYGRVQCPYCGTIYILKQTPGTDEHIAQPNIEIEQLYHDEHSPYHKHDVAHHG